MALGIRELLIAAFLLVMSIMVTIFACTLVTDGNGYPMLPLMFYLFTPVPFFLCGNKKPSSGDGFFTGSNYGETFYSLSHFLVGMFGASGPSVTLVLLHTEMIGWPAMLLSFGSAFLLVAAVCVIHFGYMSTQQENLY